MADNKIWLASAREYIEDISLPCPKGGRGAQTFSSNRISLLLPFLPSYLFFSSFLFSIAAFRLRYDWRHSGLLSRRVVCAYVVDGVILWWRIPSGRVPGLTCFCLFFLRFFLCLCKSCHKQTTAHISPSYLHLQSKRVLPLSPLLFFFRSTVYSPPRVSRVYATFVYI